MNSTPPNLPSPYTTTAGPLSGLAGHERLGILNPRQHEASEPYATAA
jgi:hypothetical protein